MSSKKIVIAEASSTIKSVADSLLRLHGYDVLGTSDGLQAWEVILAERPNLVLLGLNLPGLPGLELCRQMSADQSAGKIPVLLIVGPNDKVTKDELVASGARGHLKKPFSPKDLLHAVNILIGPGDGAAADGNGQVGNSTKTLYKAEEIDSTSRTKGDSSRVHSVSWKNDGESTKVKGKAPKKVASIKASRDEQELEIEKDQFGLARPDSQYGPQQARGQAESGDEDYDWFVGEMKKEVEGGGAAPDEAKTAVETPQPDDMLIPPGNEVTFDESESEDKLVLHDVAGNQIDYEPEKAAPAETAPEKTMSESDVERIAQRVASKLANSIVEKLDKKTLIELIESSDLEQQD